MCIEDDSVRCDHIRSRVRFKCIRMDLCAPHSEVHKADTAISMHKNRGTPESLGSYLTSTTATCDAATNPCRWFGIQESVCQQQEATDNLIGSLQNLNPECFSCLLTKQEVLSLKQRCQNVQQQGRPLGRILCIINLFFELLDPGSERLNLL